MFQCNNVSCKGPSEPSRDLRQGLGLFGEGNAGSIYFSQPLMHSVLQDLANQIAHCVDYKKEVKKTGGKPGSYLGVAAGEWFQGQAIRFNSLLTK